MMWAAVTCTIHARHGDPLQSFDLSRATSQCHWGFPNQSFLLPLLSMHWKRLPAVSLQHATACDKDSQQHLPKESRISFLGLQKLLKTVDLTQGICLHQCENNVCGSAPSGDFFVHQVNDELPCQSELSLSGR